MNGAVKVPSTGMQVAVLFVVYGVLAAFLGYVLGQFFRLPFAIVVATGILAPTYAGWLWMDASDSGWSLEDVIGPFPSPIELLESICLGMMLLFVAVALIWLAVFAGHSSSPKAGAAVFIALAMPETLYGWMLVVQIFVVTLWVPIAEEIAFRGMMLRAWVQKSGISRGTFWSAFWFGFIHVLGFPIAFMYGWFIGRHYLANRSLIRCIAAHVTINILALAFCFADLSPRRDGGGIDRLGQYLDQGPILLTLGALGAAGLVLLGRRQRRKAVAETF